MEWIVYPTRRNKWVANCAANDVAIEWDNVWQALEYVGAAHVSLGPLEMIHTA